MGLGSLIGNGIGFGVGQAGAAIADAREKEAARQAAQQANSVDLEALAKMGITLPGVSGTGRVPNVVFDTLAKSAAVNAEKDSQRAEQVATRSGINAAFDRYANSGAPAVAPQPTSTLAPGEDPEAGAFIGATPGSPARPMDKLGLLRGILNAGKLDAPTVSFIDNQLKEQPLHNLSEYGSYDPNTKQVIPPGGGGNLQTHFEHRPGVGTYAIASDKHGNQVSVKPVEGVPPPAESVGQRYMREVDALLALPPNHPNRGRQQELVNYLKPMALAENGSISGPAGGAPLAVGNQKPPGEQQVKALIDADTTVKQIQDVRAAIKNPDVAAVLGSGYENPSGAIARRRAQPMKIPGIGIDVGSQKTLTDEQSKAVAGIDFLRVQVQRAMEGLRPNSMYIQMLSSALPTADDPNLDAKLQNLEKIFGDKRFLTELTEGSMNRNAPPSQVPKTQTPAGAEVLPRTDPRYEALRKRGMTDQQIQSKYGVVLQ